MAHSASPILASSSTLHGAFTKVCRTYVGYCGRRLLFVPCALYYKAMQMNGKRKGMHLYLIVNLVAMRGADATRAHERACDGLCRVFVQREAT